MDEENEGDKPIQSWDMRRGRVNFEVKGKEEKRVKIGRE